MISIVSSLITYNSDQRRSTLLITIKVDHFVWNTCYPISGKGIYSLFTFFIYTICFCMKAIPENMYCIIINIFTIDSPYGRSVFC